MWSLGASICTQVEHWFAKHVLEMPLRLTWQCLSSDVPGSPSWGIGRGVRPLGGTCMQPPNLVVRSLGLGGMCQFGITTITKARNTFATVRFHSPLIHPYMCQNMCQKGKNGVNNHGTPKLSTTFLKTVPLSKLLVK